MDKPRWAIRPQVPDEVYTDRQEFIDYFYHASLEARRRRTMSTVLLGQRRMGKTEIFTRVVNQLFFDQDHTDPQAVVPVYFAFPEEGVDRWEFSVKYVENLLRWYTAFHMNEPAIISERTIARQQLSDFIRANIKVTPGLTGAINIFEWLQNKDVTIPEQSALTTPRSISDRDDTTIVMFLDEFQNTHLPQYTFRLVGFMQEAVESSTCPHFVTGSAIGILKDLLGRGALFGRFLSRPIEAFTNYYGEELVLRTARYYEATVAAHIAPVISERCGGNPFYITAVVRQAANQRKILDTEEALHEMLAVDISSGFVWAELHDQVTRWISRVNEYGITKWVLYLAAQENEERINLERIQQEIRYQEKQEVSLETIRDVLVKLSRGDLIDYKEFGGWFSKINDPILEEFLKIWGRIEVVGEHSGKVREETLTKYQTLYRRFTEYKGYLAEVYMIQILWNSQRKTLPGRFFHASEDITMPDRFIYIAHRSKLGAGSDMEVDIYATAGKDVWIAESKWWDGKKVGPDVVRTLLEQAEHVKKNRGEVTITTWLFAHDGVTKEAEALLQQHQILWSTRAELDELLTFVKLRTLPDL